MSNITDLTKTILPGTTLPNNSSLNLLQPSTHPVFFENVNINSKELTKTPRTFEGLTKEIKENASNLNSNVIMTAGTDGIMTPVKDETPKSDSSGSFKFTAEDGDQKLSGSNTRHLFKNLYGETLLTFLFFSKDNINNIQKLLKMLVFKQMNKVIDDQSNTELMIIMRSIFLEYSQHPPLIDEGMSDITKNQLYKMYSDEVLRLNELVLNELVPLTCSQLQQYLTYIHDINSPRVFMDKPIIDSLKGEKEYRSITSVLTGSAL